MFFGQKGFFSCLIVGCHPSFIFAAESPVDRDKSHHHQAGVSPLGGVMALL